MAQMPESTLIITPFTTYKACKVTILYMQSRINCTLKNNQEATLKLLFDGNG